MNPNKVDAPYFIEVCENGCSKCGADRTWDVIGPDGVALSQSYHDEEDASWLAEQLNDAYFAGRVAERNEEK